MYNARFIWQPQVYHWYYHGPTSTPPADFGHTFDVYSIPDIIPPQLVARILPPPAAEFSSTTYASRLRAIRNNAGDTDT
jgi:hypothetical protein